MLQTWLVIFILGLSTGAAGSFMITDWWNGISYSSAVADAVKDQQAKQAKSEAILKAQIEEKQKTRIVYRTIRSRANEIHVFSPCLNAVQHKLWNEATTAANSTEADKPDGTMRKAADVIKNRIKSGVAESH